MCQFFSCVSEPDGDYIYFSDWEVRQRYLAGELQGDPDSHTSIAHHAGYESASEDGLNCYEYNPLTGIFKKDRQGGKDDSAEVLTTLQSLNWKTIVPALVIKPIIHPFKLSPHKVTQNDIALLKKWVSVADSVRNSVVDSVWASVRVSVGNIAIESVWDSVIDSMTDCVIDSVFAYSGSFFTLSEWKYIKHKKGEYPFQCCVDLWERGLVPGFDGKTWRLHGGLGAKILYEWKP